MANRDTYCLKIILVILHIVTLSEPLVMNVKDQNTNILSLIKGQTKNRDYATNYVKLIIHL